MGVALSVFRLVNTDRQAFLGDISSLTQHALTDPLPGGPVVPGLPTPTSEMKFIRELEKGGALEFEAVHYTETRNQEIRVFFNEGQDVFQDLRPPEIRRGPGPKSLAFGYQEIYRFRVVLDFKKREILAYYATEVVESFMRRLRNNGKLEFQELQFDMSRIAEMPNALNVYATWMDSLGRVRKKALFGTGVDREPRKATENVTSYYMEYRYGERTIDLFVAADGRIGSRSAGLRDADAVAIYREFEEGLGVKEQPTD